MDPAPSLWESVSAAWPLLLIVLLPLTIVSAVVLTDLLRRRRQRHGLRFTTSVSPAGQAAELCAVEGRFAGDEVAAGCARIPASQPWVLDLRGAAEMDLAALDAQVSALVKARDEAAPAAVIWGGASPQELPLAGLPLVAELDDALRAIDA